MKTTRTAVFFPKHSVAPFAAAAAVFAALVGDASAWGVTTAPDRDKAWSFSLGQIVDVSGRVDETFRAFYKATGQDWKQSLAESYDLKDFGVDAPYTTFGLHYRRDWRYFAFRWDLSVFSLSADAKARRDYYIGLGDDVRYGGRKYDHMKIPSGSSFSVDFRGGLMDGVISFTPVELAFSDTFSVVPSLDLGLAVFGGEWEIDAGEARGTATYQNPPVDFVVGGSSSSLVGAGAPMLGAGLEFRVGRSDWVQWVTRLNAGFFKYDGSTKFFTGSGREKDLELDYASVGVETRVELPMTETTCLELGGRLRFMTLDAEIRSKERDTAAIVAARERFDKSADLDLVMAELFVGVSF